MAVIKLNEEKGKSVVACQSSEHTPGVTEDGSRVYYGYINIEHPVLGDFYVSVSVTGNAGEVRTDGKPWKFLQKKEYKLTSDQVKWVNSHKKELARMAQRGYSTDYLTEDVSSTSKEDFGRRMQIASLISKNNEGELDAIEGYQELLSFIGDEDKEAVEIIEEIISDEKNHIEKLNQLMLKYDSIEPNKE